jgi:uncharacterized protein (TIGR00304 family)
MSLLFLGIALILLGFLILIWPRSEQKDDAHDAQRPNQGREIQERRGRITETQETKENSGKSDETKHTRVRGGAVVMIGPIPIAIGSDPKIALFIMIIALAVMILWVLAAKGN